MEVKDQAGDVKRLFETGAHFAQVKSRRHPSMKSFVVGSRGRQEILDLTKTAAQLEEAKAVLRALAREGKTVLWVGGKVEVGDLVRKAAQDVGAPYVSSRWLGGTISNWSEIKKRIERLAELAGETDAATRRSARTKLELVLMEREKTRLSQRLDGIVTLTKRPDALVVVDTRHEKHAVKEARAIGIPVIAIMGSDCDLSEATHPIVANDTSRAAVAHLVTELAEAFKAGRAA